MIHKNMKDSGLKKIRFGITVIFAVMGVISELVTICSLSDLVKTVSQFITYICLAVVAIMIVIYVILWLEAGTKYGEILQVISQLDQKMDNLHGLSNFEAQTNIVQKDIESLKNETAQIQMNTQKLNIDPQIIFCPVKTSSYVENSEDVNNELYRLLKNKKKDIKELHIICFGRNGFGGVVKYIIECEIDINVKIIVFNPQSHPDICLANDDVIIRRNIETWLKGSKKIEVIVSEIPPMVRAAVAYVADKDGTLHAIWGSIQSYRFALNPDTKAISLEKPTNSLISVCEESKTVTGDLYALVNSFEEEFRRLEEHSQIARIISKPHGKSEIVFEEKKP